MIVIVVLVNSTNYLKQHYVTFSTRVFPSVTMTDFTTVVEDNTVSQL